MKHILSVSRSPVGIMKVEWGGYVRIYVLLSIYVVCAQLSDCTSACRFEICLNQSGLDSIQTPTNFILYARLGVHVIILIQTFEPVVQEFSLLIVDQDTRNDGPRRFGRNERYTRD